MPATETEVVPKRVSVGMDQNQMRYPSPCSFSRTTDWLNNREPYDRIGLGLVGVWGLGFFVGVFWVFAFGYFFGMGWFVFFTALKSSFYG